MAGFAMSNLINPADRGTSNGGLLYRLQPVPLGCHNLPVDTLYFLGSDIEVVGGG